MQCLLVLAAAAVAGGAQGPDPHAEALKKLSPEEQAALARPDDPRGRIKTYVQLAGERLKRARTTLAGDESGGSAEQLATYALLVADAGRFAAQRVPARDRAHKMLEQALRDHMRVLETMRREISALHVEPVEQALAAAERVRRQALNTLLGDGQMILQERQERQERDPEAADKSPVRQP